MATLVTPGGADDAPARLPPKQRDADAALVTIRQRCLARIKSDRDAKRQARRTSATPDPRGRARALLDDVLKTLPKKRARDDDGADAVAKRPRDAPPARGGPDLDEWTMTPEDEAGLMRELEDELRAWDREVEDEEAILALTAEAAGLAFDADARRDAFEGPTVPCPCCATGRLGRRGADLAIACNACDLELPDQRDGLSLGDVSACLASTFWAHVRGGCPRSPVFRVDDRTGVPLLCATCDACGYFDLVC